MARTAKITDWRMIFSTLLHINGELHVSTIPAGTVFGSDKDFAFPNAAILTPCVYPSQNAFSSPTERFFRHSVPKNHDDLTLS